jgi:ribosome assembly protein YihI (activator of Der GTPase)
MAAARKRTTMTPEHKRALAQGRAEGRAVRNYLEALDQNRPRRGRPRTPASIEKRLKAVESELADASPLQRLQLVQERMNLERELDRLDAADDLSTLERDFVKVAKGYAQRKGISYAAWRELGVAPDVLRKAGIGRGA